MKTRYPITLVISLCTPLMTIALARVGTGPLASHPAFAQANAGISQAPSELTQAHPLAPTRETFLRQLTPAQRVELGAHLPTLTREFGTEAQVAPDVLVLDSISYYARKAQRLHGTPAAAHALEQGRALIPLLQDEVSRGIAQGRIQRAKTGTIATCALSSPGNAPQL